MILITTLILCFPLCGLGTRIFTFSEDTSENSNVSSATLNNAIIEPLPNHFVICSSHKQQDLTPNTIYVLYEDSEFLKPWFSIGVWYRSSHVLWANVKFNHFYRLTTVPQESFLSWVHICVEIDTIASTIRTSINGGAVSTVYDTKDLSPVPKLHLRLGIVHQSYDKEQQLPFIGSVANINIYNLESGVCDNFLPLFSGSACKMVEESVYLAWSKTQWNIEGMAVKVDDVDEKIVCSKSKVLNFRIPMLWNKIEATDECRRYGHAIISKPPQNNVSNLENDNIKTYGELYKQCEYFWTSYTDEYLEGTFVDELTNEKIRIVHATLALTTLLFLSRCHVDSSIRSLVIILCTHFNFRKIRDKR